MQAIVWICWRLLVLFCLYATAGYIPAGVIHIGVFRRATSAGNANLSEAQRMYLATDGRPVG